MIRRFWNWLKSLFGRKSAPSPAPRELDEKLAKKMAKKRERMGRFRPIRPFGPRMPRYQPCPICRAQAKRKRKTAGGAHYQCRCKHGFFVSAKEKEV